MIDNLVLDELNFHILWLKGNDSIAPKAIRDTLFWHIGARVKKPLLALSKGIALNATNLLECLESHIGIANCCFVGDGAGLVSAGDLDVHPEVVLAGLFDVGGLLAKDKASEVLDEDMGELHRLLTSLLLEGLGPPVVLAGFSAFLIRDDVAVDGLFFKFTKPIVSLLSLVAIVGDDGELGGCGLGWIIEFDGHLVARLVQLAANAAEVFASAAKDVADGGSSGIELDDGGTGVGSHCV